MQDDVGSVERETLKTRLEGRLQGKSTMAALEEGARLSRGHLSKLLKGTRPISRRQLVALAGALDELAPAPEGDAAARSDTLSFLVAGCSGLESIVSVGEVSEAERRVGEMATLLAAAEGRADAANDRAREEAAKVSERDAVIERLQREVASANAAAAAAKAAADVAEKARDAERRRAQALQVERDSAMIRASEAQRALMLPLTGTPVSLHMQAIGVDTWMKYALHVEEMNRMLAAQLHESKRSAATRGALATIFGIAAVGAAALSADAEIPSVPGGRRR